ncbi:MAG: amidase [Granulosicoccus sp.]|nr:amidase [Granulosicoccus sp.]
MLNLPEQTGPGPTLEELSLALNQRRVSSRMLVEQCLASIDDPAGEGARVYLHLNRQRALDEADACDRARQKGYTVSPFQGIPISVKDLFDCAGEVTQAGSHVLDDQPPAEQDATIVALLRRAGFIVLGKTNMTEFAFSGLGVNAHYGTPLNPWDRATGRIPGGSSSGGAVSVADGMAAATIGTDTGGSCRIPAAFCGIVGLKPTSRRVSQQGVVPLSRSLDSVGPLARSVRCCTLLDAIISGEILHSPSHAYRTVPCKPARLGVMQGYVTEQLDDAVASAYDAALQRLSAAGHALISMDTSDLSVLPEINARGGLVGAEAYTWHQHYLQNRQSHYDPWVLARLLAADQQSASDYIEVLEHRVRLKSLYAQKTQGVDALVLPAVAVIPPTLASMKDPAESGRVNLLTLRNTAVGNFLDRPSVSIPCHAPESPPAGFMLMGQPDGDAALLALGDSLESVIRLG